MVNVKRGGLGKHYSTYRTFYISNRWFCSVDAMDLWTK
ncbi:hypothetical protein CoNPh26_CDS0173 [Staphylococcus phage S-CoN_Ph26]|nr:hypothetical protein CoNPh26_CDS0173 [Staphylococcus phage S-CoN_Ph26]